MSLAVVRCPGCRGASRVAAEALGQMVGCPRCQMPFVAEEDIPVVQPVVRPAAVRPATVRPRPRAVELVEVELAESVEAVEVASEVPDPEHDPHTRPVAGLPVSVLVGLALVPFAIPPLWLVGPLATGLEPALSMAVPVALAFSASALCLGVVYTIDWSATTRVKGVIMLVALAYLTAAGLFFLKKDLMDWWRGWTDPTRRWSVVTLDDGKCRVQMPGQASKADKWPLADLVPMKEGKTSTLQPELNGPFYVYQFAVSLDGALPRNPDDAWFARVGEKVLADFKGQDAVVPVTLQHGAGVGREWQFNLDSNTARVVRVYVYSDRVYYLSAEGPNLSAADKEFGEPFFGNFAVGK